MQRRVLLITFTRAIPLEERVEDIGKRRGRGTGQVLVNDDLGAFANLARRMAKPPPRPRRASS